MPFKISKIKKYQHDKMSHPHDGIYVGYSPLQEHTEIYIKMACILAFFGFLSLFTAWIFTGQGDAVLQKSFSPNIISSSNSYENVTNYGFSKRVPAQKHISSAYEIGPLIVRKARHTYHIDVAANLREQSWSFIEAELLDKDKNYLFSFTNELSYYKGYEGGERWVEQDSHFDMNITFPKAGTYYLRFASESNKVPSSISVRVRQQTGSAIPHFVFGILCLIPVCALFFFRGRL